MVVGCMYIHVIDFTALNHDLQVDGIRRLVCFISVRVIGRVKCLINPKKKNAIALHGGFV